MDRKSRMMKDSVVFFPPSFHIDQMDNSLSKYFFGLPPTSSIVTLASKPHLRMHLFAVLMNATGLFTKSYKSIVYSEDVSPCLAFLERVA